MRYVSVILICHQKKMWKLSLMTFFDSKMNEDAIGLGLE
jgi:hypothetical protein